MFCFIFLLGHTVLVKELTARLCTLHSSKLAYFLVSFYAFFQTRKWLLAGNGTTSSKCIPAEAAKFANWSISRKPHWGFWDCNIELKWTLDSGEILPWNAYGPYVNSRPPRLRTWPALWNRRSVHMNGETWIRLMFKMKSIDCFPRITERQYHYIKELLMEMCLIVSFVQYW